ncbi:hypothetical protein LOY99_005111 [Ophidiomyces ophidiicola]|nr:hypothetical protein LOZ22_005324 [Ophidiomyces ophidiicola]KAI2303485.1 hypothetical protein LOY99_005111 [Ophidiomyces ophidiicola]KAI2427993.1 hypothetical protein LOZ30_004984 [Ophidiomyces ophidiicola]
MARTGMIYMAGALSTIFTLLSTVANGAFATGISRELSGLGAFQVVSVTGCALSCVLQGFLVFFLRRRLNRHVHVAKQQERRALIAVAVVLGLDVAVVAMAIRWSSTRIGEISSGETRGDVRLLFALWCTLWAIAVVFQVTCFGVLVVWGREDDAVRRRRRRSTVPAKHRHTKRLDHDEDDEENRILGSIEQARSTQQGPGDEPPEKPRSRASSMSQLKISYFLRDLAGEQEPPADHQHHQQPGARKSSSDSQRWERGFSRRVPELHDELQKINLHASASTATLSTYMHGSSSRSVRRHDALYPAPLSGSRSPSRGAAGSCRHSTMRGTPSPAFSGRKDDKVKEEEEEEEEEPVVEAATAENIHPLFRSSTLSIPGVSPGTTVTASPFAGQTISMHTLQQIRSRGRPRSQSLGVHYKRQQEEEKEEKERAGCETAGRSSRYPSGAEAVEEKSSSSSSRSSRSRSRNSGSGGGGGGGGGRRKSQMSVGRRGSSLPPCR